MKIRLFPLLWIRAAYVHVLSAPPHLFEDRQLFGPWRNWRHRHVIEAHPEGSRLVDDIEFTPPFGILGRLAAPLLILPRLRRIFRYRHEVTRRWCETAQ